MDKLDYVFIYQPFTLVFVLGIYLLAVWLYKKTKIGVLHPVLTSIAVIILILKLLKVEFQSFEKGSYFIDFMLGPSVVALGYGLYEQFSLIRRNLVSILTSVFIGSLIGVLSVAAIAIFLGADETIVASLEPKSVTTPIAIQISERFGGIPPITTVVVISIGIFGGITGPFIMDKTGIHDKIARGLGLGASAHGIGTARAIEIGAIEGAVSGITIGLMGLATAILVPLVRWIYL